MAVAASTPITVVTQFNPLDGRWTWAAYREQMLLLRSRPSFDSKEGASEAGDTSMRRGCRGGDGPSWMRKLRLTQIEALLFL